MPPGRPIRRYVLLLLLVAVGVLLLVGIRTYVTFSPAAITLGPNTTLYFRDDPRFTTRVHEAIHRRQMREKSWPARIWNAVRYNFDYGYRLAEEAEAKAGEICLQIHRFSPELPVYTSARSISQARTYRAWAWERMGVAVPDRVGEQLMGGDNCHNILRGIELDLQPGAALSFEDSLKLATLHFLQAYGSDDPEVETWKARLRLSGLTEPAHWDVPEDIPPFGLLAVGRTAAAAPDTSIDADAAGRALHRLTYSSSERIYIQLRPPPPGYRGRTFLQEGEAEERIGIPLEDWPGEIVERGLEGDLDENEHLWLQGMAVHPVHEDFETFALAPSADIVGERYRIPFGEEWNQLALSEIEPVRRVFLAQWGRAALAAHAGDLDGAEAVLRTVIAGAVQLAENAPFEVEVVEALQHLDAALATLRHLDRYRDLETPWLEDYLAVHPSTWLRGVRPVLFSDDASAIYVAMPALAGDPGIPWAFRRVGFRQVVLIDVCLGLHTEPAVREAHRRWLAGVEAGLVRRPSDRGVLDLMRRSVRDLLEASAVAPDRICSPAAGIRPDARMAIMRAPLARLEGVAEQ